MLLIFVPSENDLILGTFEILHRGPFCKKGKNGSQPAFSKLSWILWPGLNGWSYFHIWSKTTFLCKIFLVRHISTPWSFYRTLRKITCVGNCVGKAYAGCVGGLFPYASPEHGYKLSIAAKRIDIKKSSLIMQLLTETIFSHFPPCSLYDPLRKPLRKPCATPYG